MKKYRTVLIVDDEADFLSSIRRVLRSEPYDVATALEPGAALQLLAAREVHLLVSDYKMPGMDGIALLRQAREDHPGLVTVLVTALCDVGSLRGPAAEAGIADILLKPIDVDHFKGVLRRALASLGDSPA